MPPRLSPRGYVMIGTLDDQQVAFFRENGYLTLPLFSREDLPRMRREASSLLEFLVNSSLANQRTSARLDIRKTLDGAMVVRKIQPFLDISTAFAELARDERIVSIVRQLMGGVDPEPMEDKFSYKQYLNGPTPDIEATSADAAFHPHADYAYHVAHGYPPTIITCAVALDDCTADKGPFHVWPGTHKEFIEHADLGESSHIVEASRLAGREERDILVSAGTAIFFSDLLVHDSKPNKSQAPRRIIFFSYCPAGDVVDPDMRNAPTRRLEREHEMRYLQLKKRGQYRDRFSAPSEID